METCKKIFWVNMKKLVLLTFVSVLLFGTIFLIAVSVQDFLMGDYSPQWRNETEYALLWMQPAVSGFDNWGTATYKDGVLYVPSMEDNHVYAINASIGDIIWKTPVQRPNTSPCIDGDVIYVGELLYGSGYFPRIMALNRTTGEQLWQFIEPNNCGWAGSPLVHDDYLYATTFFYPYLPISPGWTWGNGSGVYALNKINGNILWHQNIGAAVCSVAHHNGVVFVSTYYPPGQYALNATTGDIVWHVSYGRSWDASPVIYQGMVIQALNGRTCVLNETTGERIRSFEDVGSKGTPLVHDGKIFIPTSRVLWAFDLATGDELWRTVELHDGTAQENAYCSPAGACGAIYYQSLNGTFYVIDETNGSIRWSYALAGLGFGSPIVVDGGVFITNDGGLYAFAIGPGVGSEEWPMFCQNHRHISYAAAMCPSAITCALSFAEVTVGDSLTVSGTLSPARADHVVTITCTKPDDSTLHRTVTTRSDGSYSETITLDAAGSWDVQASWAGDMEHREATSEATSFEVKPKPFPLGTAAAITIIAILGAALLFYFTKLKK